MKKSVLLTLVIISLIISGCKNLSLFQKAENSLSDSVNVQDESGDLTVLEYSKERTAVELIFNAELAAQGRYAMPSSLSGVIDSTDYSVYASVSSDRGVTYKQYKCECTGSTMRFSNYAISTDTAVTLKIRFIAVYGNTYNAANKVMQSNEISVTIPANTKIASYGKSVLLFPATSVAENVPGGKVCLKLSSDIASDSFMGFGTDGYADQFDRNFVIVGDTLYHKTYADPDDPGLAPGSYTVQIGCFTSGSVRKSLITQTIIVYQGLTTDKWAETGSDTFSFAGLGVKEFYVKSSNTSGYTGWPCTGVITGGEGEGSIKFPYVNIASAIARISTLSDKTSEYTIYCEGVFSGLTDGLVIPDGYKIKIVGLGTKKSVIDLAGTTGKTIISVNGTDSRNGTSLTLENMELRNGKRGIAVTRSKLILKNCDIHDNDAGTDYGAGIVCFSESDVYIMDNVTIHHNKAKYGAGISFGNESYTNIVINCVINGENTKIYANKATTNGGGVYIKDNDRDTASKFILKKGSIFANCADSCGGGIYISGGGNTKADVTIEGGKIAGNKAERGGGIYCNTYANFKLKGGVIGGTSPAVDLDLDTVSQTQLLTYENKGNYVTLRGGGIYASGSEYSSGCEIELSGGNVISNGPDASVEGAGVYGMDRTFNISGGFSVAASNSFYIAAATKLTITGDLTPPQSYTTIARIEYVNAAIGKQVLYGDSTLILNNYTKFLSYVQNSSSEYFKIDSTGKLIPYD